MLAQDFLRGMVGEIDQFDPELYPPKEKIESNEKVICTIDDPFLRRLYSVTSFYRREASKAGLDCKLDDAQEGSELRRAYGRLHIRHEAFAKMFWSCTRSHYNLYDMFLGMRKDWAIVTWPEPEDNPVKKLLDALE